MAYKCPGENTFVVPLDLGYGEEDVYAPSAEAPLGYHFHQNIMLTENGDWVTRFAAQEIVNPNPASNDAVTDIYIIPGQNHLYCIKNGSMYYKRYAEAWSAAITGLGFTPSRGTWTQHDGYTVYCDFYGVPVKFPVYAPTTPIAVDGAIWPTNRFTTCATYQNRLLISDGNMIYFSAVGTTTMNASDYITAGGGGDTVQRMLLTGGTLVVMLSKSLFARTGNNADLASNQLNEHIRDFTMSSYFKGSCTVANSIYWASAGGVYAFEGSEPANLINAWQSAYFEVIKPNAWLKYWPIINHVYLFDANKMWVFDLKFQKWYRWVPPSGGVICMDYYDAASSPYFLTGHVGGKIYMWSYTNVVNPSWSGENTISQSCSTPWFTPGLAQGITDALSYELYLKRLYIYAYGLDTVTVYGRKSPNQTTPDTLLTVTGGVTETNYGADAPDTYFHEIKIVWTATGRSRIKKNGLLIDVWFKRKRTGG